MTECSASTGCATVRVRQTATGRTTDNWKWFILKLRYGWNYSREQYLGKVSVKWSSFCQVGVFKSISETLWNTVSPCRVAATRLSSPSRYIVLLQRDRGRCNDCETFRTHLLMSSRTIRVPDKGGWSGLGRDLTSAASSVTIIFTPPPANIRYGP